MTQSQTTDYEDGHGIPQSVIDQAIDKQDMTNEDRAREVCAKLIPHTTSSHNVSVVSNAITEAYAHGRRDTLVNERYILRMLADIIASTPSYTGGSSTDTDAVHIIVVSRINDINAILEKEPS